MDLLTRIERAEDRFREYYKREPEYLIIGAVEAGELAHLIGEREGVIGEESYISELNNFENMTIAVVYRQDFIGFELR